MRQQKCPGFSVLFIMGIGMSAPIGAESVDAAATAARDIEQGRYLIQVSGCNDCHTPGYMLKDGNVPEAEWLTGDVFGWNGPWGTTYGSNLRLLLADITEDEWVQMAKTLKRRPPMPWFNLNVMREADLRAIYRFVNHLGPAGGPAPAALPPGETPQGPYAVFPAPPPQAAAKP